MDTMVFNAGQREQEVRDLKRDVADLMRHIQRLNAELEAQLRKVCLSVQAGSCRFCPSSISLNLDFPPSGRGPAKGNPRDQGRRGRTGEKDPR